MREATRDLSQSGQELATEAQDRASEALDSTGTTIRQGTERVSDALRAAGESTSSSIAEASRYLRSTDLRQMRNDVMALFQKHPGAALWAGLGTGLLVAQIIGRRPRA